ncbi:hypothetical protein NQ314_005197 [Rhamnusium bicolor]|uniref:Uncharacterized protein n=1 Tax=Rhamnusium bicolor TaxID=1586634 RepID=A0AAV8ZKH3_9CUCU|nr:hypothetical protein NQ314_005197 [Rhamnusium bicolor]
MNKLLISATMKYCGINSRNMVLFTGKGNVEPEVQRDPLSIEYVEVPEEPVLANEKLNILGDGDTENMTAGEPVHADIALGWQNILKKGLEEEARSELLKKYPMIPNCQAMQPPKLNPEVRAAANELALKEICV